MNRIAASALRRSATVSERLMSPLAHLSRSFAQGAVLGERDHRPWPVPSEPWLMAQSWEDLLFAHWRVPVREIRPVVPAAIPIDTYDGDAWIGVTPFQVTAARLRGTPHLPGVTAFAELNVRTYSTIGGRPGLYFLSLDAASRLAVAAARRAYRLPYFHARMAVERRDGSIGYRSARTASDGPPAALRARYRPTGEPSPATPGSLEHWLAERYCLYTMDERQRVHRAEIHHRPWPIQPAEAELEENTMAAPYRLELRGAPILHFSRRQDVVLWGIAPIER